MKRIGTAVQYFGVDIVITKRFVATDRDGAVFQADREFHPSERAGVHFAGKELGGVEQVAAVDLEGMDWKDTAVEFDL